MHFESHFKSFFLKLGAPLSSLNLGLPQPQTFLVILLWWQMSVIYFSLHNSKLALAAIIRCNAQGDKGLLKQLTQMKIPDPRNNQERPPQLSYLAPEWRFSSTRCVFLVLEIQLQNNEFSFWFSRFTQHQKLAHHVPCQKLCLCHNKNQLPPNQRPHCTFPSIVP